MCQLISSLLKIIIIPGIIPSLSSYFCQNLQNCYANDKNKQANPAMAKKKMYNNLYWVLNVLALVCLKIPLM